MSPPNIPQFSDFYHTAAFEKRMTKAYKDHVDIMPAKDVLASTPIQPQYCHKSSICLHLLTHTPAIGDNKSTPLLQNIRPITTYAVFFTSTGISVSISRSLASITQIQGWHWEVGLPFNAPKICGALLAWDESGWPCSPPSWWLWSEGVSSTWQRLAFFRSGLGNQWQSLGVMRQLHCATQLRSLGWELG